MTRKRLLAGNWKMNGNAGYLHTLYEALNHIQSSEQTAEVCLIPPFTLLAECKQHFQNTPIRWGAQNVHAETSGAYTGEISSTMLVEMGCHYVLLGHSERRQFAHEIDTQIAEKLRHLATTSLTPIVCIGETLAQRQADQTYNALSQQLEPVLSLIHNTTHTRIVIAYEPVWAIGTGQTATPQEAQTVHHWIRQQIGIHNKALAPKIKILYGGSMKPENASDLLAQPDIDGGLVGGASLNCESFTRLITLCSN